MKDINKIFAMQKSFFASKKTLDVEYRISMLKKLKKVLKDNEEKIIDAMHKDLGKQVSYQYLLRLECYKLIKHLLGEKTYEGFKIWW